MASSHLPRLSFTTKKGNKMLLAFVLMLNVNGEFKIIDHNLSGQDCVEKMLTWQNENLSCHFQKETE